MLEGNRREYQYRVGIGEGDYDGKQEVEAFGDKYGRLRDAAVDAERRLGSVSSNGGKIVYDMVLINTGKKEIEGKTIGEAWNLLKRKTDGQIHQDRIDDGVNKNEIVKKSLYIKQYKVQCTRGTNKIKKK